MDKTARNILLCLATWTLIGCDLLIFDFRMRFADYLEQIEILAREVLPKVGLKVPA